MAKVVFQNNWLAPNGHLFRKSPTKQGPPVDVPENMVEFLPKTARLVPKDYETPEKTVDPDTISEHRRILDAHDPVRAAMEAESTLQAQTKVAEDTQRAVKQANFKQDLLDENAKKVSRETSDDDHTLNEEDDDV